MKKIMGKIGCIFGCGVFLMTAISCVSTSNTVSDSDSSLTVEQINTNQYEIAANKPVILEWDGQTLGEPANPDWLRMARRGNAAVFKSEWGISELRVVPKPSEGRGKTLALAQTLARTNFIYQQAAELGQKVIARIGSGLNSANQLEAVYDVAAQTRVDMTGLREEASFWQKVQTTGSNGRMNEEYVYYIVYSIDKETWDKLVERYLNAIIGGERVETETQRRIRSMISELQAEADRETEQRRRADELEYQVQMARINAERVNARKSTAQREAEETTDLINLLDQ